MKALVTGANGFTGAHLVRHLIRKGYEVRGLIRPTSKLDALAGTSVEYAHADLAEDRSLASIVDGVDVVFHIAAAFRSEAIPRRRFEEVNVGGTKRLLEAARRTGVERFVHCSTVGVQGEIENPPATEEAPYRPGDHYQRSKRDGEVLALEFFRRTGLPGTVVRPAGIYGPGDRRFVKLFRAIDSRRFRMIGPGTVRYHLTYVDDLVAGIALAGETDAAVGEVFTLAGSNSVTINELVSTVAAALGRRLPRGRIPVGPVRLAAALCEAAFRPLPLSPPLYRRRLDFFTKDRAFDISKARRMLGYEPRVPLEEGIRRTADSYRRRGWLE